MEMRRVPAAGYEIVGVPIAGFHRKMDRRNLSFPAKLIKGLWASRKAVKRFDPDVAMGTGGFASGPALAAASLHGASIFLQEQNALPGVTNRMLGRFATRVFTAYEQASAYFPDGICLLTGNPLRGSLRPAALGPAGEARAHYKLGPGKPTLLSFGGSQGARSMNDAHVAMHDFWSEHDGLQLIWQTGEGYYDRFKDSETAKLPNVSCVSYLERMDLAYAAADAVACRAGALSVSELQLLGKPALLIPSPNVSGDHQTANAKAVAQAGGAILVPDKDQVEVLSRELPLMLTDRDRLHTLSSSIAAMAKPDAAQEIAELILRDVSH